MLNTSESEISKLNASLPPDFLERHAVMQQDCEAVAGFGKNISVALFEYHADCFRIVNGGANCTLRRALGQSWDQLFDTPFEWSGAGLKSCDSRSNRSNTMNGTNALSSSPLSYGDFQADNSYKCAVCSGSVAAGSTCATPAIVRLTVCPTEVWWPRATSAAVDALSMCQSNPHCAFLCYGHDAWNRTRIEVGENGRVDALRKLSLRQGRQTALFHTVHAVKRVVRPMAEVVEMCGASPDCRDGPALFGRVNTTTNVCARIYPSDSTRGCPDYSRVLRALAEAAPVLLEPQYNMTPDQFCAARSPAAACQSKLIEYGRDCAKTEFRGFCRRQAEYLNFKTRAPVMRFGISV